MEVYIGDLRYISRSIEPNCNILGGPYVVVMVSELTYAHDCAGLVPNPRNSLYVNVTLATRE